MTKRQREVLQFLADNPDEDLVMDGGHVFYGLNKTNVKLVYNLLRMVAISQDSYSDIRFYINETGHKLLRS